MKKNQKSSHEGNDKPLGEAARAARVRALKQAVATGTYRVDDSNLANSLLGELLWEEWQRKRFVNPPGT